MNFENSFTWSKSKRQKLKGKFYCSLVFSLGQLKLISEIKYLLFSSEFYFYNIIPSVSLSCFSSPFFFTLSWHCEYLELSYYLKVFMQMKLQFSSDYKGNKLCRRLLFDWCPFFSSSVNKHIIPHPCLLEVKTAVLYAYESEVSSFRREAAERPWRRCQSTEELQESLWESGEKWFFFVCNWKWHTFSSFQMIFPASIIIVGTWPILNFIWS